jgi:hypothetical protein
MFTAETTAHPKSVSVPAAIDRPAVPSGPTIVVYASQSSPNTIGAPMHGGTAAYVNNAVDVRCVTRLLCRMFNLLATFAVILCAETAEVYSRYNALSIRLFAARVRRTCVYEFHVEN